MNEEQNVRAILEQRLGALLLANLELMAEVTALRSRLQEKQNTQSNSSVYSTEQKQ